MPPYAAGMPPHKPSAFPSGLSYRSAIQGVGRRSRSGGPALVTPNIRYNRHTCHYRKPEDAPACVLITIYEHVRLVPAGAGPKQGQSWGCGMTNWQPVGVARHINPGSQPGAPFHKMLRLKGCRDPCADRLAGFQAHPVSRYMGKNCKYYCSSY
jgi:hypothetical protein